MKTTIIIRNFVGKAAKVEVDLDSTIANLKPLIPSKIPPIVTYQGHELRDHRTLSYYGIQENAILHTVPPSKCPYVQLQFERPNRAQFTLQISSDTAVSQLMKDIAFEEKLPVHGLSFSSEIEDDEDSDTIVVSDPQILPPDALISEFPLENATIFVHGSPPPKVPPAMFDVRLTLYDDGRKLGVQARLQQTLEEFRLAVKDQHGVDIAQDVLILVGKELVGEDIPVWDLGFHPGCTVHAVPFFSFNVEIVGGRVFDTMLLHPLTRLSKIRELLRDQIPSSSSTGEKQFSLDDYWFTLTGRERLKDWRNLWDLSIISGSTLYMRSCTITLLISIVGGPAQSVDVEEDETIAELKERFLLIAGRTSMSPRSVLKYRGKLLRDEKTVKEEELVGGELLIWSQPLTWRNRPRIRSPAEWAMDSGFHDSLENGDRAGIDWRPSGPSAATSRRVRSPTELAVESGFNESPEVGERLSIDDTSSPPLYS